MLTPSKTTLLAIAIGIAGCAAMALRSDQREVNSLMAYLDKQDVSAEERSAALETFLEDHTDDAVIPEAQRWREYLVKRLQSTSLGIDEGLRTGDLLRKVVTKDAALELETHYAAHRSDLAEGNKVAIVMAAEDAHRLLASVLADAQEFMQVREAAFERMAELGSLNEAQEVTLRSEDPTLALTATRVGALYAKDVETLKNIAETAKRIVGKDAHGRAPLDVAHIAISESNVSGKSLVMLDVWESSLQQTLTEATSEEARTHAAVTGMAMARAIWTETDPAFVANFLEGRLLPVLQARLTSASDKHSTDTIQIIAEFSSAFRKECASRPVAACSDGKDPRVAFSEQLRGVIEPHIAKTELEFYLHAWN